MSLAKILTVRQLAEIAKMMGRQKKVQNKLFYTAIILEQHVRKDHILRKVKSLIDFDFIYKEVKDTYGYNGHESVPPVKFSKNENIENSADISNIALRKKPATIVN